MKYIPVYALCIIFTQHLYAIEYERTFLPATSVFAGDTIFVQVKIVNDEQDTLKGLSYTEQIPANIEVTNFGALINQNSYPDIIYEQGLVDEIYSQHKPYRWVFQYPPGFMENGFLLPGDSAKIYYGISSIADTTFLFNQDAWYGGVVSGDTLQSFFGFDSLNIVNLSFFRQTTNQPPVVADIPDQIINEGQTFATISLDTYVTDPDNLDNQIIWTYTGNTQLTVNINANRVATIVIPNSNWNGNETISFTATDPGGLLDSDPATFTVTSINDPPVVADIPDQTIIEGDTFVLIQLDSYVNDPDNPDNEIIWTSTGNTQLTVNIDPNRIATVIIPNPNWTGNETITFTATDSGGLSDSDPATFTITPISNSPPTQVQNLQVTSY